MLIEMATKNYVKQSDQGSQYLTCHCDSSLFT